MAFWFLLHVCLLHKQALGFQRHKRGAVRVEEDSSELCPSDVDARLLVELCEDLGVSEDGVLFLADFDVLATVAGEEDAVARLQAHLDDLAILVLCAGADGDDGRFRLGLVSS